MKRTAPHRLGLFALLLSGLSFAASPGYALDRSRPEIAQQDSVISIEHRFVTDLSPDSVAYLLFRPDHLIESEKGTPGEMEIDDVNPSGYNVRIRYSLLLFYRNRMVLHRSLEQHGDTLMVRSRLVDFWQTVGVAPEPTSSCALYIITPKPYGGTVVTYRQETTFQQPLGSYAYRYFSGETERAILSEVDYIHRFEPVQVAQR